MEAFLEQSFSNEIQTIKEQIQKLQKNLIIKAYTLVDFNELSKENIEALFLEYGFPNCTSIAEDIYIYNILNQNSQTQSIFKNHLTIYEQKSIMYIEELNNIIMEKNNQIIKQIEELKKRQSVIKNILHILFENDNLEEEDYSTIFETIMSMNISDSEKLKIAKSIVLYLEKKRNEPIREEEQKKSTIKKEARRIYEEFFLNQSPLGTHASIKDKEEIFSLEELNEIAQDGYDLEMFSHALLSEIRHVEQGTELSYLEEHSKKMLYLVKLYKDYVTLLKELEEIKDKLNKISINGNSQLSKEELNDIYADVYSILPKIKDNTNLQNHLETIKIQLQESLTNNEELIPMKLFILFLYDPNTRQPYFIRDIIEQKMIDSSSTNYISDASHKKDIEELFYELMTTTKTQYLSSLNTSAQNSGESLLSRVCFDTDTRKATDMYRIRYTRLSELRYIEKRITLKPDTTIYHQVIEIIKKYMKGITIDEENDFILSINYCIGIKKSDYDTYATSIKRRYHTTEGSMIQELLSKKSLSDKELSIVEDFIVKSIEAYNIIREADPDFKFEYFDRMVGRRDKYAR